MIHNSNYVNQVTGGTLQGLYGNLSTSGPRWKFCPEDGQKFEDDWSFCPKCGKNRTPYNPYQWGYLGSGSLGSAQNAQNGLIRPSIHE